MKHSLLHTALWIACLGSAAVAAQELSVSEAWVRGTVAGQNATGAFMQLKSTADTSLIAAASPLAKSVELHEMAMEGGVMKMRALPRLDLPAGREVEFKPGGYHIMLMGLTKALKKGDSVPIELTLQGKDKKTSVVKVAAQVRELGAAGSMSAHEHKH